MLERRAVGKKKKLRKARDRLPEGARAIVVCVGKKCAPRDESEGLFERLRRRAEARGGGVIVARAKCLGVCEGGPVVATLPEGEYLEGASAAEAERRLDRLLERG
jgi:(2Fe-2S) ferredoxin